MLKIYCDGACSGNPGPGGWAFVIPELNAEQSEYEPDTTNNRMEIKAVIEALNFVINNYYEWTGEDIEVITDSQYVINTMTKGWQKKKNTDLWDELEEAMYPFHKFKWTWVKGHADNKYNQRCDELAVKEYKEYQKSYKLMEEKKQQKLVSTYGKKIPLNALTSEDIAVTFRPIETYDLGYTGNYVIIYKMLCSNCYLLEANKNNVLCAGSYEYCLSTLAKYKESIENTDRGLPF